MKNFIFSMAGMLICATSLAIEFENKKNNLISEVKTIAHPISDSSPKTLGGLRKEQNEIAITVDDGPNPVTTPQILKIFRDYEVKATFFLVGENVKKYPELVKSILREGHSVANHSWSHQKMTSISLVEAAREIDSTSKALQEIVEEMQRNGETENAIVQPFFRFPFGDGASDSNLIQLLRDRGLANFYWRMSAHDSRTSDPAVALKTSIEMIDKYQGGIFLMHETHPAGLAMLPQFLDELRRRRYKTFYFKVQR